MLTLGSNKVVYGLVNKNPKKNMRNYTFVQKNCKCKKKKKILRFYVYQKKRLYEYISELKTKL